MTLVVGIDPGGRNTGVVVRRGAVLVAHTVVTGDATCDLIGYVDTIDDWITNAVHDVKEGFSVAVESVQAPTGFKHGRRDPINLSGLIGTAVMYGALRVNWFGSVGVAPNRNGSAPRQCYPPELWGAREGPAGTGRLRHCRSAWDVAGAACASSAAGGLAR